MDHAISVSGLEKSFKSVHALAGVQLDVPLGSSFGLIGPNGAGKTTFIKILLGLTFPSSGKATVLGGTPSSPHIRRRIGYLPERLTLPDAYTPAKFLESVARLKGVSVDVPSLLDRVGLEREAWKRSVGKFSKGMRQRTGLAAALIGDPELLILDEPTDGIDPMGRAQIRDVIKEANKRGATVFLNSHLLAETEKVCDHIAVLSKGKIVTSGSIDSLRRDDAFSVHFASGHAVKDQAAKFGFVPDDDDGYRLVTSSAAELSTALKGALGDGLIVEEVRPALVDLETVMREAVGENA